jgi:hypothetical protein
MMAFWKHTYLTWLQFPTFNVLLLLEEVFHYEAFDGFSSIANISYICFCYLIHSEKLILPNYAFLKISTTSHLLVELYLVLQRLVFIDRN